MNLKESFASSLKSLKANKMRAFLTMLGIIIGISSVIMITTLGSIVKNGFGNLVGDLGINNYMEIYVAKREDAAEGRREDSDLISIEMIDDLNSKFGKDIKYTAMTEQ